MKYEYAMWLEKEASDLWHQIWNGSAHLYHGSMQMYAYRYEAIQYIEKTANEGHLKSIYNIGRKYKDGVRKLLWPNPDKEIEFYNKAIELDPTGRAEASLARFYGTKGEVATALTYFELAKQKRKNRDHDEGPIWEADTAIVEAYRAILNNTNTSDDQERRLKEIYSGKVKRDS